MTMNKLLLIASLGLAGAFAQAQWFYTGATNGSSWEVPSNWSTGVVPGPLNDVQLGYSNFGVLAPLYTSPIQIWSVNASARNIKSIAPLDMRAGQLDIYGDLVLDNDLRGPGPATIEMRSSRLFFQTSAAVTGGKIHAINGISYLDVWTGQTLFLSNTTNIRTAPGAILRQSTFFYRPGQIFNAGIIGSNSIIQLTPSAFFNSGTVDAGSNALGDVDPTRPNLEIATQYFENSGTVSARNGGTVNLYMPEFVNYASVAATGAGSNINLFAQEVYASGGTFATSSGGKININGNLHMNGNGAIVIDAQDELSVNGDFYGYGNSVNTMFSVFKGFSFASPAGVVRTIRNVSGPSSFFESLLNNQPNSQKGYVRISNCTTTNSSVHFNNDKVIIDGFNADLIATQNAEILFPGYRILPSNWHCEAGTTFLILNDGQKLAHRLFGATTNNKISDARLIIEGSATSELAIGNCEITNSKIELAGPRFLRIVGPVNVYSDIITALPPIVISRGGLLFQALVQQPYSLETEAYSGVGVHVYPAVSNGLPGWKGRVTINQGTTLKLESVDTDGSPGIMKATTMVLNGHLDAGDINTDIKPAGTIYFLVRGEVILGPKFTYNVPPGWSLSNGPSGLWIRKN